MSCNYNSHFERSRTQRRQDTIPIALLGKLFLFLAMFSVSFFLLRTSATYQSFLAVDLNDLGGVPWLYSVVGLIFSILAAFVIQSEWEHWSSLVGAMKDEVSALDQLWHWSHHFPEDMKRRIHQGLRHYIAVAIEEGWACRKREEDNEAGDTVLASLRDAILETADGPELRRTASSLLAEAVKHRRDRLNYGTRRMPRILRYTLMFADGLVIVLSLFIGVRNMWLDYLFTISIALLAYLIYLVVNDLDHPLRPGIWHVTPTDYQRLLRKL